MIPGDVHWVELPPAPGHKQAGRRPAIVLQDAIRAHGSPLVITIPLTIASAASRFPGTLLIQPTEENGLRAASIPLVFQIRAVDRRIVRERMGRISPEQLNGIRSLLDELLGRNGVA